MLAVSILLLLTATDSEGIFLTGKCESGECCVHGAGVAIRKGIFHIHVYTYVLWRRVAANVRVDFLLECVCSRLRGVQTVPVS